MSKHPHFTRGPWRCTDKICSIGGGYEVVSDDGHQNLIAIVIRYGCWFGGNTQYEPTRAKATARLVAQAPALLQVLEKIIGYDGPITPIVGAGFNHPFVVEARAIIAKAKGEQS